MNEKCDFCGAELEREQEGYCPECGNNSLIKQIEDKLVSRT